MNVFYKIYFFLPNFSKFGIIGKGINFMLRKVLKVAFDFFIPNYLKRTQSKEGLALNTIEREEKYVVSLTTFPERINSVWITIETVMRQSFKPDEMILWLDEKKFEYSNLPESLLILENRGLTISFCEDVRSHTKYYHAMKKFPNYNIITLDDDCYYPNDILKTLFDLHKKYPKAICSNRAHKILCRKSKLLPYRKWKHNCKDTLKPSHSLVQTGVSGVLYPSKSLHDDVFDKEIFKEKCYFADDLWLKLHSVRNNVKIVTSKKFNKDLIAVSDSQNEKLVSKNVFNGGNDLQLRSICDHYNVQLENYIDNE